MKINKNNIPKFIIAFFILCSFMTVLGVKAWLDTNPAEVIPPDSFIKTGQVITIIEEDEKYFYKIENFNKDGTYSTPAMESQITYDEYSQLRSNGTYDILEKRNRHVVDDIYVDEYYKAYSDGETMAGNYIAEVLDGYFVPVELDPFKSTQNVLINDGGIYYLATYHFDKNYNYTKAASYLLLSENQYNTYLINENYDYIKEVKWEISYDGNTITKTISYYDKDDSLLSRPIILQMTGFEDLDGYIESSKTETSESSSSSSESSNSSSDSSNSSSSSSSSSDSNNSSSSSSSSSISSISSSSSINISSIVSEIVSSVVSGLTPDDIEEWLGSEATISDGEGLFPWETTWQDNPDANGIEGNYSENGDIEKEGFYDDAGNFIQVDEDGNILPSEPGEFDENGNFTPDGADGYFDPEGIYHPEDESNGEYDEDGNFNDGENSYDENGNIIGNNEPADDNGYYDENGNFIQKDGTIIDENGVIHKATLSDLLLDEYGRKYVEPSGYLTLNELGQIVLFGYDGYYETNGLFHNKDNKVGYFNENGAFIESRELEYDKGFYDEAGYWHDFTEIYKTENGTVQLVTYPEFVISTDGVSITIGGSTYSYSDTGLVVKGASKGYFNQDGEFIKSDKSAYKGGFYDSLGRWIDDSLYTVNTNGEISLSYAYYDCYGVFTTPNKDRGYFNQDGEFVINRENVYAEGYFYFDKDFQAFGEIYIDSIGNVHKTGSDEIITTTGQIAKADSQKGVLDKNNNYFNIGNVITKDGKIGHYNEFRAFEEGQIPYKYGYYDAGGNFFRYDGIVITADGKVGYYDENGNFIEGVEGAVLDANGNWVLPDGTVITPDGKIGYYDENGVFHEGENPYSKIEALDGSYIDSNGNTVLADGTVITPDGLVGYYDENGVFHEGENPYSDGYYDENGVWHSYAEEGTVEYSDGSYVDSNGNTVLADGTVITPDGLVGYYDENGVFHVGESPYEDGYYDENGVWHSYAEEGTVVNAGDGSYVDSNGNTVLADGTVITPDGLVGYYDENGVFHEGENPYEGGYYDENGVWHSYEEEGTIDENGNIILADGTVITPDGVVGYYDENGVFHEGENPYEDGYYDENGVWHSTSEEDGNIILADGTVITPDGVKGYYDENGVFHEGENPYENGYYDENGVFHEYGADAVILADGTVITADGVKGYYDENGEFHEGENPYEDGYYDENGVWHEYDSVESYGYYDADGNWIEGTDAGYVDVNGNTVLPNGVVITPDGKVGYYDENGVFHEGESPYENGYYDENGVWHSNSELGEGAYYDENGNLVMADGTVITPDGKVGYYDANGVFHEGDNPYTDGYYDENGNWISDGYYDANGNYIMSDGTIVQPDGTVILPDGTIVTGQLDADGNLVTTPLNGTSYYDADGNEINGVNPDSQGYYDADGNYYLVGDDGYYDADGNYHSADGTIGYYDENGEFHEGTNPYVNGFYDENGVWHGDSSLQEVTGYYDSNGVFHEGENPYTDGFYDENGNWHSTSELGTTDANGNIVLPNGTVITPDGKVGYYDENGVFHQGESPYEDGYYDANGVWHSYEAASDGSYVDANGNTVLADGTVISANGNVGYYDENGNFIPGENPYEGGYYDANGVWHSYEDEGTTDANGNIILADGTVITPDGVKGYYDENGEFHEGENPYSNGYYDANGVWHSTTDGGITVDENGNTVLSNGVILDKNGNVIGVVGDVSYDSSKPLVGYYDENGNYITGESNPYEGGYYDSEGNWHSTSTGENVWIDANGNAHISNDAIGYYDADGNFHLNGDDGYYDKDGTYHSKDGKITGYYDENGVFHEGETNPYSSGYYDSEGNWHPVGEDGYYDKDGNWHDTVSNSEIGYYDENGVWHEGTNPYVNGYYDENGKWHGNGAPETYHYDKDGNLVAGKSDNDQGWYDAQGNFHPYDEDGYFDAKGTYHKKDGSTGYYDADGIWHDGTNPYTNGYYDADGNWHPFDDTGYYDVNGTYHSADGTIGYYDENGVFHEGKENPYEDGWYDADGNFHPYGEVGWYDADGVWHEGLIKSDTYKYGSDNYVLFTGRWRSASENAMLKLAGNTVQFTINKKSINSVYVDTGIYVALHSILEFEEAKDILHSIAISTGNTFIQDNDSCMIIYNGSILTINKDSVITVKTLKDLFENTNIDITVAKTRIGKKYALVEAIESGADLKIKFDDTIITPKNPLVVINNEAYVSLKDIKDIIFYEYSMKPNKDERTITFTLKKSIPFEELRSYYASTVTMVTNSGTITYTYANGNLKIEDTEELVPTVIKLDDNSTATYIPLKIVTRLTGCNASYDTTQGIIDLHYTDGLSFMEKFYDASSDYDSSTTFIESIDDESNVE